MCMRKYFLFVSNLFFVICLSMSYSQNTSCCLFGKNGLFEKIYNIILQTNKIDIKELKRRRSEKIASCANYLNLYLDLEQEFSYSSEEFRKEQFEFFVKTNKGKNFMSFLENKSKNMCSLYRQHEKDLQIRIRIAWAIKIMEDRLEEKNKEKGCCCC